MAETKGIVITLPRALITTAIIAVLGWGWRVEHRMTTIEAGQDLTQRVKSIEDALLPILVDWKVQKELAEKLGADSILPEPEKQKKAEIRRKSEDWANKQIKQMPIEEN